MAPKIEPNLPKAWETVPLAMLPPSDSAVANSASSEAKRVILRFGPGSLAQPLSVTLQMGPEGKAPTSEVVASLAPDAALEQCFQAWDRCYSSLAGSCRPMGIPKADDDNVPSQSTAVDRLACERAGRMLGDRFNQWLRQPSFLLLREAWLEKLRPEDELRVILQTQDRVIQRLPWHQWDLLERYPKAEIALGSLSYNATQIAIAPNQSSVKILAILGDSSGIDVQADRALLEQLPGAEVTFLVEPQRSELNDQLWQQPWHILFFAGHSSSQGGQGRFRINGQETLALDQLKFGLRRAVEQGLQLAIFNSCDGLGLAQEFASLDIPQLIVMREPVPDRVAQAFLKYFLAAYRGGAGFYPAVRQGRERLQAMEGEFPCANWLPMIFQNPAAVPLSWRSLTGQPERLAPSEMAPSGAVPQTRLGAKWLAKVAVASLLTSVSILAVRHLGWLQPLELKAFDHLLQLRPQEPPDSRLLIIEVTEEDVTAQRDEQPQGSLSDTSLSKLLTLLNQHDPVAIGLDIYRDYPAKSSELTQQLENSDHLVAVCRLSQEQEPGVAPPPEVEVDRQGFSDGLIDADQVVRRHLLAASTPSTSPCGTTLAFSTQLALRYLAEQDIELEQLENDDWLLGKARIKFMPEERHGSYQTEDLWGYQTLLNYRSHRSIEALAPRVSLGAALNGELQTELIRDRIILIGTTAESFRDYSATPYSTKSPGVILQAQMVSQLLSAALDGRALLWIPPWWADLFWLVGWAGVGAGVALWLQAKRLKLLFLGLGIGLALHYGLCLTVLVVGGGWLPLIPGSLALLLSAGIVAIVQARGSTGSRPSP